MRVCLTSLGCFKNLVDGESLLGLLGTAGHEFVSMPGDADAVIVNTCGFIRQAQRESIERILEIAALKRNGRPLVIVSGCLAQGWGAELLREMPEVDAVLGTGALGEVVHALELAAQGERNAFLGPPGYLPETAPPRLLSTPPWTAYVKISEGCDNRCRYCLIPYLRGPNRSRPAERVLEEVNALVERGVREIVLVGQDLTRYGEDLRPGIRLPGLLRSMAALRGIRWIRMHYLHPARVDRELLETIAGETAVCAYLDLPMQHGDDGILAAMGRGITARQMLALLDEARSLIPGVAVRTSMMTGFPGETERAFRRMLSLMQRAACDWAGVFAFSPQEGTPAARMPAQVPALTRIARRAKAMALQRRISRNANQGLIGREMEILVETRPHTMEVEGRGSWPAVAGRSYREAPEVDGRVHVLLEGTDPPPEPGSFVRARVVRAGPYDVYATIK